MEGWETLYPWNTHKEALFQPQNKTSSVHLKTLKSYQIFILLIQYLFVALFLLFTFIYDYLYEWILEKLALLL